MWFIDYLNVHQDHPEALPIVGSQMVLRIDLQTGERLSESPKAKSIEGSHSTVLNIRCDGTRVSLTGNASRWQRLDNVFGFETFEDCIAVYNNLLDEHGLPRFTKCSKWWHMQGKDGTVAKITSDGAMIDHIDFTRNFSVSEGKEYAFLRGLSGQSIATGRSKQGPYLYGNGATVDWYKSSTMLYKKVYIKAVSLIESKSKSLKHATEEERTYYQNIIDWCNKIGLLREEHSFKAKWLRRNKLCFYGLTRESDFKKYLLDIENAIARFDVMKLDYETIAQQLIENKIVNSAQAACATQAIAHKWLHGMRIEKTRQYYVHRPRLLQLGIDISLPYDVTKLPPQIRSNTLIEVKPVDPPSWYRMPKVLRLKQVA